MTAEDYLQLVAARTTDVLNRGGGGGHPVSLTASWAVAFDRLAADNPEALQLLTVAGWLGPEPVPLTLITGYPDQLPAALGAAPRDPLVFAEVTGVLRRRGMARMTPGQYSGAPGARGSALTPSPTIPIRPVPAQPVPVSQLCSSLT